MPTDSSAGKLDQDETLLRRTFDIARQSRAQGDYLFGALLADGNGEILIEQGTAFSPRAAT